MSTREQVEAEAGRLQRRYRVEVLPCTGRCPLCRRVARSHGVAVTETMVLYASGLKPDGTRVHLAHRRIPREEMDRDRQRLYELVFVVEHLRPQIREIFQLSDLVEEGVERDIADTGKPSSWTPLELAHHITAITEALFSYLHQLDRADPRQYIEEPTRDRPD